MGHLSPVYPRPLADTCLFKRPVVVTRYVWVSGAVGGGPGPWVIQAQPTLPCHPPLLPRVDVPKGLRAPGARGSGPFAEPSTVQWGTDNPVLHQSPPPRVLLLWCGAP